MRQHHVVQSALDIGQYIFRVIDNPESGGEQVTVSLGITEWADPESLFPHRMPMGAKLGSPACSRVEKIVWMIIRLSLIYRQSPTGRRYSGPAR